MREPKRIPINFKPGVQRDGTQFDTDRFLESIWNRWDKNRPRKIGGYRLLTNFLNGASRELSAFSRNGFTYIHSGHSDGLDMVAVTASGSAGNVDSRTPVGFIADPYMDWQFAQVFNATGSNTNIVAHAAPNLFAISSDVELPYYVGDIASTTAVTEVPGSAVSGGVVELGPFLFRYGNDGQIGWSDINLPINLTGGAAGTARPTSSKIVRGLPLRGSGSGPAGLFWSLDSLLRATFAGGAAVWNFDTVSDDISVLSSNSIVEMDGIYYWAALERFQMFAGVVKEIPNDYNRSWFFENLNFAERQKVFTMKIPAQGEIWWCFPKGSATECNWAIVLNVRYGFWYDTPLPSDFRSSALYAQVYPFPIMGGTTQDPVTNGYPLWQHESGVDRIEGQSVLAIKSSYTTPYMTIENIGQAGSQESISVSSTEPDFIQTGDMTATLLCRANAKSAVIESPPVTIQVNPTDPNDQLVNFKTGGQQVSFKFESNVAGGNYWMGKMQADVQPSNKTRTQ